MKLLANLWQDLRFGLRLLTKNRKLTAAVVLTLAVVIGADSLVFSVVRAVLVRQLDREHQQAWAKKHESAITSVWE